MPSSSSPTPSLAAFPALSDRHPQYFKSIEQVARAEGFEQILPSKIRTGPGPVPVTVVDEVQSPTIIAPQPLTSRLLRASPAAEYPVRSVSPDLIPDRMASRIPDVGLSSRLTPNPEKQILHAIST